MHAKGFAVLCELIKDRRGASLIDSSATFTGTEQAQGRLTVLEKKITDEDVTPEEIQQYVELATSKGLLDNARRTLEQLKKKHPKDVRLSSLYISLCLRQCDDRAAMAAIEAMAADIKPSDDFLDAALAVRRRLGPMLIRPDERHSISLCMIVRNESAMLGACLNGIKPLVDEIILVDTGSDDRTADIGRIFGAQVHAFTWCDDFSAARNFGLSKATGRWVLVLDADEAIASGDFGRLRALIRQNADRAAAFTVQTRNYCRIANSVGWQANDGRYPAHEAGLGWFPSFKVRLFRRDERIGFHFPVHERVEPSLEKAGIAIAVCPVPVHHYGHLNEVRNQEKARQYYTLGVAKLEDLGDDPAAIRELAVQAGQLELWKEAIVLWQRLLSVRPGYVEALVNLSGAHWQLGQYEQALALGLRAQALKPDLKEARYNISVSLLLLGRGGEAVEMLERLVAHCKDYLAARFMLAAAHGCIGNQAQSRILFEALQTTPAGQALGGIAAADLIARMRRHNLDGYADALAGTSAFLNDE
jgi:tetratricopeptide (TPR) repeat protein